MLNQDSVVTVKSVLSEAELCPSSSPSALGWGGAQNPVPRASASSGWICHLPACLVEVGPHFLPPTHTHTHEQGAEGNAWTATPALSRSMAELLLPREGAYEGSKLRQGDRTLIGVFGSMERELMILRM